MMMSLARQRHEVQLRRLQLASSRLRLRHSLALANQRVRRSLTSPPALIASVAVGWLYARKHQAPVHHASRGSHLSVLLAVGASLDRLVRLLAGSPMMVLLMRRILAPTPTEPRPD